MSFAKCLLLALSVVASVNALTTPHVARHSVHHRSIAARAAEPRHLDILPRASPSPTAVIRRRCKPKTSSTLASSSATSTKSASALIINAAPIPTTTSTKPAPTTTTKAAPTTTPAPTTKATTTKAATPTTTAASSGGGSAPNGFLAGVQSGQGTFYATGLGACGITNNDSQPIIAVSHLLFDTYPGYNGVNPNNNPLCGKQIVASRGGKSVTVTVTDRCEACKMTDLDFSPSAFDVLGLPAEGRIPITWVWA